MTAAILTTSPASRRTAGRGGFSFAEVLFAVLILGIGFIMVAAVFPVALTQTKAVGEETNAASVCRGAVNQLQQLLLNPTGTVKVPVTVAQIDIDNLLNQNNGVRPNQSVTLPGMVVGFREKDDKQRVSQRSLSQLFFYGVRRDELRKRNSDPTYVALTPTEQRKAAEAQQAELWRAIKGNLILPSDQRFGWVPMFRRDVIVSRKDDGTPVVTPSPVAQVFVIAVESRTGSGFVEARDLRSGPTDSTTWPSTLDVKVVKVDVSNDRDGIDLVKFASDADAQRAAEGTYLIISDDAESIQVDGEQRRGVLNGRIVRLGNRDTVRANTWEITPGTEFPANERGLVAGNVPNRRTVTALMIGRGYTDAGAGPGFGYDGPALDVAIYTAFVRVSD